MREISVAYSKKQLYGGHTKLHQHSGTVGMLPWQQKIIMMWHSYILVIELYGNVEYNGILSEWQGQH